MGNIPKLLVTGAKGMLGTAVKKVLADKFQIIGIDIEDADITDKQQIQEVIFKFSPEIILHCAAYTNVDGAEKAKELAYKINCVGTRNVAEAAGKIDAKLVYISTDFVFNGNKKLPYTEDDTPLPINTYGWSKLEGEKAVKESSCKFVIIRTAWLYGPNGKNFVDTIIELAQKDQPLKVVNDQKGCPTYTMDLAEAIGVLLENGSTGIFHIVNSDSCTWYEFAKQIIMYAGINKEVVPITSAELPRPAKRPHFSVLSTEKFTTYTGYQLRNWQDACKEYIEHER